MYSIVVPDGFGYGTALVFEGEKTCTLLRCWEKGDVIYTIFKHNDICLYAYFTQSICMEWGVEKKEDDRVKAVRYCFKRKEGDHVNAVRYGFNLGSLDV